MLRMTRQRQDNGEGTAVAGAALHVDGSTVLIDDFGRDIESQS